MKTMKKLSRRGLALVLALLMCLSMVNLTAFASETTDSLYVCDYTEEHEHTPACYRSETPLCGLEETLNVEESEEPDPVEPDPVESDPVESDPVESNPVESDPVESDPVESDPVESDPVESDPVESDPVESDPVESDPVESDPVESDPAESTPVESDPVEIEGDQTGKIDEEDTSAHRKGANHPEDAEVVEGHVHTEGCYVSDKPLCGVHAHDASCYRVVVEFIAAVKELPEPDTLPEEMPESEYNGLQDKMESLRGLYSTVQDVPGYGDYEPCYNAEMKFMKLYQALTGVKPVPAVEVSSLEQLIAQMNGDKLKNDISVTQTIEISSNFTLDLNGKTITYTGETGSVFKVTNGTFTVKDSSGLKKTVTVNGKEFSVDAGTITGGKGTGGTLWGTMGGGIYVAANSETTHGCLKLEGGTISGNEADAGGGVATGQHWKHGGGEFIMTGGAIVQNTANSREGGGISLCGANSENKITGGQILGNVTKTTTDLGGGGIYVNNTAKLTIMNAVITENDAYGIGGGLAACVHGKVTMVYTKGAAIFGNTIQQNTTNVPTTTDSNAIWPTGFAANAVDVFSAGNTKVAESNNSGTIIGNAMLGGGLHNWSGISDGDTVNSANNGTIYSGILLALTANSSDPYKEWAKQTAEVIISGNKAEGAHGGGVASNGVLVIGDSSNTQGQTNNVNQSLTISKTLNGANAVSDAFQFELLEGNKKGITKTTPIATATISQSGSVDIQLPVFTEAGTYYYYLQEHDAGGNVTYDPTVYQITVKVTAKTQKETVGAVTTNVTTLTAKTPDIKAGTLNGTVWTEQKGPNTDSISFTNTWNTGSLTIDKTVVSPTPLDVNEEFHFRVTLRDETGNGIEFKPDDVKGASFTWDDSAKVWKATVTIKGSEYSTEEIAKDGGQTKTVVTITGIPAGLTYTVEETDVEKWIVTGLTPNTGTISSTDTGSKVEIKDELKTFELSVNKKVTWNDKQSEDPANLTNQEFTVVVTLSGSGMTGGGGKDVNKWNGDGEYTFTLKPGNGNGDAGTTATIIGIPIGTKYTVVEQGLTEAQTAAGYSIKSGTFDGTLDGNVAVTVENRYFETKTTDLTVTKTWTGGNSYKPAYVAVTLYQGDDVYDNTVRLTADDNNWSKTWTELPMYSAENTPYTYKVEETGISYEGLSGTYAADPLSGAIIRVRNTANFVRDENGEPTDVFEIVGGWKVTGNNTSVSADNNGTITNSVTINNEWLNKSEAILASITIHKVDVDTKADIPGVTFTLTNKDTGVAVEPDYKSTQGNGTMTFSGLTTGTYILKETEVHEGYLETNLREWEIVVGRGNKLQSVVEQDPTAENGNSVGLNTWSWTDADGTKVPNEGEISWSANDDCLGGTLTITNEIMKSDISVTKLLNLDGDPVSDADFANSEFTFVLYKGEELKDDKPAIDEENVIDLSNLTLVEDSTRIVKGYTAEDETATTATWEGLRYGWYLVVETGKTLDDYDNWTDTDWAGNGTAVKVMIDGEEHPAYLVMIEKDGEAGKVAVTATNSYTRDTGTLSISKTVRGDLGDYNRTWNFTVELTSGMEYVDLSRNEFYDYTYSIYELDEQENMVLVTDADGKPIAKDVPLTFVTKETEPAEGEEAEDADEPAAEAEYKQIVVTKEPIPLKHGQIVVISGIPVGVTYKVTEVEANVDHVTRATDDEGNITADDDPVAAFENSRQSVPNRVSVSVRKVWVGDGDIERPASVAVGLYKDGVLEGNPVVLNAANNWEYRWTNLDGNRTWTVGEIDIPEGYVATVTSDGENAWVITNTYEEEEEEEGPEPEVPLDEIPEDGVPLAGLPEDEEELVDEDVPLAGAPATGDDLGLWLTAAAMSALGLGWLLHNGKRKEDEEI